MSHNTCDGGAILDVNHRAEHAERSLDRDGRLVLHDEVLRVDEETVGERS